MPKCPECGKDVDALITAAEEVRTYRVHLDPDRDERLELECVDSQTVESADEYACPECGAVICIGYANAVGFLKGGIRYG
ncbi:MAG: hypothetical protein QXY07_02620 [Candidatus Bathyarchaeia archaeon]